MTVNLRSDPKVLLVYKRSPLLSIKDLPVKPSMIKGFRKNHLNHYASLHQVEAVLKKHCVSFQKRARSRAIDYRPYDLIITIGGDGTFLEAARKLRKDQFIIGVNSDPAWSVGQFCACNAAGFERVLSKVQAKKARCMKVSKLRLQLVGHAPYEAMNDILICHANPAAMSRYELRIGSTVEEHRSSGTWF
jgi:NAD+ kinase